MEKLKLSPPWAIYYRELVAMFGSDEDIHIVYDEDKPEICIYVQKCAKAAALEELLPEEVEFGNVKMPITIIPANGEAYLPVGANAFEVAFCGNPALSFVREVHKGGNAEFTYVVFAKKVVQFYTDDLGDFYGQRSTLYQNIAEDIFRPELDVFYCTDKEDSEPYRPF